MKANLHQAEINLDPLNHCRKISQARACPALAVSQALIVAMTGLLASSAFGGSEYWNTVAGPLNTGSGAGTWDTGTSSFWSTSTAGGTLTTWASDNDAFFVTTGPNTVTLSRLVRVKSLQQTTNGTI